MPKFSFDEAVAEQPKRFSFEDATSPEPSDTSKAVTDFGRMTDQPLIDSYQTSPGSLISTISGGEPAHLSDVGTSMGGLGETLNKEASRSLLDFIPNADVKRDDSVPMAIGKEAYNLAIGLPKFAASPYGAAGAISGVAAPAVTATAFTADMLHSLGKQIQTNYKNWSTMTAPQKAAAVVDILGTGGLAALTGHAAVKGFKGEPIIPEKESPAANEPPPVSAGVAPAPSQPPTAESEVSAQPSPPAITEPTVPVDIKQPVSELVQSGKAKLEKGEATTKEENEALLQDANNNSRAAWAAINPELNSGALGDVGMGGAKLGEVEEIGTSLKNATADMEREGIGLDAATPTERRSMAESWVRSGDIVANDSSAGSRLENDLVANPERGLTDDESALLLRQKNSLMKALNDAAEKTNMGDEATRAEAQIQYNVLKERFGKLMDAIKERGSHWGREGRWRQSMVKEDWSFETQERLHQAANGGKPLSDSERVKLQGQITEHKAAVEAYERALQEEEKARSQAEAESAAKDIELQAEIEPTVEPHIRIIADKIKKYFDARAAKAYKELMAANWSVSPELLIKLTDYGVSKILSGASKFVRWADEMRTDFKGKNIEPHLQTIWEMAHNKIEQDSVKESFGNPLKAEKIKRAVKGQDIEAQKAATVEQIKAKVAAGKVAEITPLAQKLARMAVEQGARGWRGIADVLHPILKEIVPDWDYKDTVDAFSGHGKFTRPSQDAISKELSDAKSQANEVRKIQEVIAKQPVKPTGFLRNLPSSAKRRLTQIYEAMKRKYGTVVTDPATQLRSALQARKTYYKNRLDDLQHEIDTKTRTVKDKSPSPTDQELESLKSEYEKVKAEHDKVFGDKKLTDEQRIKLAMDGVNREISDYERRINEADYKSKNGANAIPETPELKAARAKRDALKEQFNELRDLDEHYQQEQKAKKVEAEKTALEKTIAEQERKLATGDTRASKPEVSRPASNPEIEQLKQKRDELSKKLADARKKTDSQKYADKLERQLEDLNDSILEKEHQLATGDIATKPGQVNRPMPPELEKARQRFDELNKKIAEARKKPETQKYAEAMQRRLEQLKKAIADREAKIAAGDTSRKGSAKNRPLPPELEQAKQRLEELNKKLADLRNPPKTPEERALQSFNTRTSNRISELEAKLAAKDFAHKVKKPPISLPKASQEALAKKNRLEEQIALGRRGLELRNRSGGRKVWEFFTKWLRRELVLSSPASIFKLTSAAIQGLALEPIKEGIGKVVGKVFPEFSARTEVERPSTAKIEAKAFTQGFLHMLSDAGDIWKHGKADYETNFGGKNAIPEEMKSYFGRLHAILKNPLKRTAFTRVFEKLSEQEIAAGNDVTDPLVQIRIGTKAMKEANRMLFLEDNVLVSAYQRGLSAFEPMATDSGLTSGLKQAGGGTARFLLPIVRIPTNLVARTLQAAVGFPVGASRLAYAYAKGIKSLPPEQADLIMRQIKQGSIGGALLLYGYFNASQYGGYYQPGEKRKPGDLKAGEMKLFGFTVPPYLQHHPLLQVSQLGATIYRVQHSFLKQSDKEQQGITEGVMAALLGLAEEVPFGRNIVDTGKLFQPHERHAYINSQLASAVNPQGLQWLARQMDKRNGEVVARNPKDLPQTIKMGIPVLRKTVPEKKK